MRAAREAVDEAHGASWNTDWWGSAAFTHNGSHSVYREVLSWRGARSDAVKPDAIKPNPGPPAAWQRERLRRQEWRHVIRREAPE